MKRWNMLLLIIGICLMVFVLAACDTNGPASPTPTPTNTSPTNPGGGSTSTPGTTPAQSGSTGTPTPGQWQADGNELGQFGFTVSSDSASITQVSFHISNLKCGSANLSIDAPVSGPWSVSNGQFTINAAPNTTSIVSLNLNITISGAFDQTGKHASGTWQGSASSQTCSGNWTGNSAG